MFKQQVLESAVFQIFQNHFNELSQIKQSAFLKAEIDIEMLDLSLGQFREQQSELLQKCLKNWICSEKYFKVIKCHDNNEHNKMLLIELQKQFDLFILLQTKDQVHYLYQSKLGQLNERVEYGIINSSQVTYILKFSTLGTINQQKEVFINMIRAFNCVFPYLTITFKWIPYKHLDSLLLCQNQSYEFNEVASSIINLLDIITWKQIEKIELLLTLLPEQETLMYRSPQEFFDQPDQIEQILEQYIEGTCISIIKGPFKFSCIYNSEFKNFLTISKTKKSLLSQVDQMKNNEIINQNCKIKQKLFVIVESQSDDFNFEDFEQICQQNPKLFNTQQFQVESQQNDYLLDKIAMLYLSMQNDLESVFSKLDQKQQEYILDQFKLTLLKSFVIDQL